MSNWRIKAACRGADPGLFYSEEKPGSPEYVADTELAKAVCATCPVRLQCLEASLNGPEGVDLGVWGGLTYEERLDL